MKAGIPLGALAVLLSCAAAVSAEAPPLDTLLMKAGQEGTVIRADWHDHDHDRGRDHDRDRWRDRDHDRWRDHDHDRWRDRDRGGWRDRDRVPIPPGHIVPAPVYPDPPPPPVDAATQACRRAASPADCMTVLGGASFINDVAAAICGGLALPEQVSECIPAVADKMYLREELSACDGMALDADRLACLRQTGRKVHDTRPPADGAFDEAAALCGGLDTDALKIACLAGVAKAMTLDEGAVALCGRLDLKTDILGCLAEVVDKKYSSQEIAACAARPLDDDRIGCLNGSGRAVR